jgi:hypothetical protein
VTCSDGSASCVPGQCGTDLAGQCFYPEPVCPAPPPVPALPRWLALVGAVALGLFGAAAYARRVRPRRYV